MAERFNVNHWRHPSRNPNTVPLTQVAMLVSDAADASILSERHETPADQTRAAVFAAFECALNNGLIQLVPVECWPEFVHLDPPYRIPEPSED